MCKPTVAYWDSLIWFVTYQSYVSGKIDQLGTQAKAEWKFLRYLIFKCVFKSYLA